MLSDGCSTWRRGIPADMTPEESDGIFDGIQKTTIKIIMLLHGVTVYAR